MCCGELEFYDEVNIVMVISSRSVNLLTFSWADLDF